jgi:putative membrane protein insertion efficiency factor
MGKVISPRKTIISLLHFYRIAISPYLGSHCRFHPSCSQYALSAVERYGVKKGLMLTIKRLSCCHPFHPGGIDFIP